MHSSTWKKWEGFCASLLGGKRRGPDTEGGKSDGVNTGFWALEAKIRKRIHYQELVDACKQAEENAEQGSCPIVMTKRLGEDSNDSLVVFRLDTFREWFL